MLLLLVLVCTSFSKLCLWPRCYLSSWSCRTWRNVAQTQCNWYWEAFLYMSHIHPSIFNPSSIFTCQLFIRPQCSLSQEICRIGWRQTNYVSAPGFSGPPEAHKSVDPWGPGVSGTRDDLTVFLSSQLLLYFPPLAAGFLHPCPLCMNVSRCTKSIQDRIINLALRVPPPPPPPPPTCSSSILQPSGAEKWSSQTSWKCVIFIYEAKLLSVLLIEKIHMFRFISHLPPPWLMARNVLKKTSWLSLARRVSASFQPAGRLPRLFF